MSERGVPKEVADGLKSIINLSGEESAEYIWKFFSYYYLSNGDSDEKDINLNKLINNVRYMQKSLEYYKDTRKISHEKEKIDYDGKEYSIEFRGLDWLGDSKYSVTIYTPDNKIFPDGSELRRSGYVVEDVLRNIKKRKLVPNDVLDKIIKIDKRIKSLGLGLI